MIPVTLLDHLIALLVFLVVPMLSAANFSKSLQHVRDGGETAKVEAYRSVILTWLVLAAALLSCWWSLDRSFGAIGFRDSSPEQLAMGFLAAAVVIAGFILQGRKLARRDDGAAELRRQMGEVVDFLPATEREGRWFYAVSFNAGITEEIIYRGFALWYLQAFMPVWLAALVATAIFGLAHLYQGIRMLPSILFVSAIAVGLYLLSGSLLVPVIFHIVYDCVQGYYLQRILGAERRAPETAVSDA